MAMSEPIPRSKRRLLVLQNDPQKDATTNDGTAPAAAFSHGDGPPRITTGSGKMSLQDGEKVLFPAAGMLSTPDDRSPTITTNLKAADISLEQSPSSTSRPEVHEKRTDTLAIVLGIVFGLVFLAVVCLIAFLCFRRRRKHGSFLYQDNIGAASVDSVPATALDSSAFQKEVSTASTSPERQPTQPVSALETITEKSSERTSPTVVPARTSPVNDMVYNIASNGGESNSSPAGKSEPFPVYYPPLPAPHQLSSLGRRHSSEFAYVPNDPFYDSNTAIFELHAQQQQQQILQQQQQQQMYQPQHMRNRSRGSLSGNAPTSLAPLREYPEHNGFREPRNPLPQDPREQALYNYRTTPDMQPNRGPNGQHKRPRVASLPAPPPDQTYRTSPDMSSFHQSPDQRLAYRHSPETGSLRRSPDMSSYQPSPELANRYSPDMPSPRRSFEEQRRTPPDLHHAAVHRSSSLHHPIPKRAANFQQRSPAWPWPQNHPAAMGLPPTSNPSLHPYPAPSLPPPPPASYLARSMTSSGGSGPVAGANLTPAARFRAEMMRYKQLHQQHQQQQRKQSHRRWTSEPHLLASNMRIMQNHPALQRKPVPLPRMTPIPPLEEVKLPAFWWEEETEDQHLRRQSQRRSVGMALSVADEAEREGGQQDQVGEAAEEQLQQRVDDFFLNNSTRDRPLRRFSFESRPVVDFNPGSIV